MDNKNLIEEIKKIQKMLGVDRKILFESENELTEAPPVIALGKKLARILFSDVIKYGGRDFTKNEVSAMIRKVGVSSLSNEEKEVLKIVTSRAIAKDSEKTVLNTIARDFVSDLKTISDDAVAESVTNEFKVLFKSIMKKEDADILEQQIKTESKNISKPITPTNLDIEGFKKLSAAIDGSKIKDLSKVTNELIATVRYENPGITTTEIVKKIIDATPDKTWTPEFIMNVAGRSFNFSTKVAGDLSNFILNKGGAPIKWMFENPWKTTFAGLLSVLGYVGYRGLEAYGTENDWAAFRSELGKILANYPCLNGYILPRDGYYDLIMSDRETKYPAIWENGRLWYIKDTIKKEKISEVTC